MNKHDIRLCSSFDKLNAPVGSKERVYKKITDALGETSAENETDYVRIERTANKKAIKLKKTSLTAAAAVCAFVVGTAAVAVNFHKMYTDPQGGDVSTTEETENYLNNTSTAYSNSGAKLELGESLSMIDGGEWGNDLENCTAQQLCGNLLLLTSDDEQPQYTIYDQGAAKVLYSWSDDDLNICSYANGFYKLQLYAGSADVEIYNVDGEKLSSVSFGDVIWSIDYDGGGVYYALASKPDVSYSIIFSDGKTERSICQITDMTISKIVSADDEILYVIGEDESGNIKVKAVNAESGEVRTEFRLDSNFDDVEEIEAAPRENELVCFKSGDTQKIIYSVCDEYGRVQNMTIPILNSNGIRIILSLTADGRYILYSADLGTYSNDDMTTACAAVYDTVKNDIVWFDDFRYEYSGEHRMQLEGFSMSSEKNEGIITLRGAAGKQSVSVNISADISQGIDRDFGDFGQLGRSVGLLDSDGSYILPDEAKPYAEQLELSGDIANGKIYPLINGYYLSDVYNRLMSDPKEYLINSDGSFQNLGYDSDISPYEKMLYNNGYLNYDYTETGLLYTFYDFGKSARTFELKRGDKTLSDAASATISFEGSDNSEGVYSSNILIDSSGNVKYYWGERVAGDVYHDVESSEDINAEYELKIFERSEDGSSDRIIYSGDLSEVISYDSVSSVLVHYLSENKLLLEIAAVNDGGDLESYYAVLDTQSGEFLFSDKLESEYGYIYQVGKADESARIYTILLDSGKVWRMDENGALHSVNFEVPDSSYNDKELANIVSSADGKYCLYVFEKVFSHDGNDIYYQLLVLTDENDNTLWTYEPTFTGLRAEYNIDSLRESVVVTLQDQLQQHFEQYEMSFK